jgi:hypothetical protein
MATQMRGSEGIGRFLLGAFMFLFLAGVHVAALAQAGGLSIPGVKHIYVARQGYDTPGGRRDAIGIYKDGKPLFRVFDAWLIGMSQVGRLFVLNSSNNVAFVEVYNLETQRRATRIFLPRMAKADTLSVSSLGTVLVFNEAQDVLRYDPDKKTWAELVGHEAIQAVTGKPLALELGYSHNLTLSEDGKQLAFTTPTGEEGRLNLFVLDIETKQGKALGEGVPIAWTGSNILLGDKLVDGFQLYQWDTATGKDVLLKLNGVNEVSSPDYSGGVLVTDITGEKVGLFSLDTRKMVGTVTLQPSDQTDLFSRICVLK